MGGDLGETGGRPQKFEVGNGPYIRPLIFWETVILDAWQSTNWVKKGVMQDFFVKLEAIR